ncbi:MAG: response regulator transcription factor [Xanthobacteraceae bacterium]|nr:response regulator transcription factor [Xanthobacteraceae bacterium]
MSAARNTVLIIDDEPKIRRFLRAGFELHGYAVVEATSGAEGLKAAMLSNPDIITLDLLLPDMGGSDVLERLRGWASMPVIILSAVSDEAEKVRLLKAGADDYVTKPFGIAELVARCEAALRRYFRGKTERPVVVAGPLTIDLVTRIVTVGGAEVKLTRKEYRLLQILAAHAGLVVTHDLLIRDIWGDSQGDNIQYLRILVRKLRQKIEADPNLPRLVVTESGVGYRLQSARTDVLEPAEDPA